VAISPAGSFDEICGYAEVPNPAYPGELLVHFPFSPAGDYWLLDSDYEKFASVYASFHDHFNSESFLLR
jgi:hypothetical protein